MKISNPAFDYDKSGHTYSAQRRTDPRIERYIHNALGNSKTVLNVGAGAGSYEPADRYVVAVEPSEVMREQRLKNGKVPAVNANAGNLPFSNQSFDASMACVTVHHWPDISKGLAEMRRVTKGAVLILTFDPDALDVFWNTHYFPRLIAIEKARYPKISLLTNALGGSCEVLPVPVPFDCVDGFQEAYYGRPEAFLDPEVRKNQSAWGFLEKELEAAYIRHLADDLANGVWDHKYGIHRKMESFTGALRLIVSKPV